MPQIESLVAAALESLGGRESMVPGAKLRATLERLSADHGLEVGAVLRGSGLSFRQLIEAVPDVVVLPRPGSDMLVGFLGAEPPMGKRIDDNRMQPASGLRKDVYEAFTRLTSTEVVYSKSLDKFSPEFESSGPTVPVPKVRLDDLLLDRRKFAETLDPPRRTALLAALDGSLRPLASFQSSLAELDLGRQWHAFHMQALRQRIVDWGETTQTAVRDSWFETHGRRRRSPQQALARIAAFMSDEEIRNLVIPFRAVEALLESVDDPGSQ